MVRHNNMIPNVHLRKHWTKFVKTWFNQAARKRRRQLKRQTRALAITPRPLQKLRPVTRGQTIRYNSLEKAGRGFSLLELKEAGLNAKFAKTIGISVDHRRINRSQEGLAENVKRIKAYLSKLVLYPRQAGRHVNGVVADSSAEVIKGAVTQNAHPDVIDLPKRSLREKGIIVSAELKKASVFKTLRSKWYNAKFVGIKQKRREALEAKKQ